MNIIGSLFKLITIQESQKLIRLLLTFLNNLETVVLI